METEKTKMDIEMQEEIGRALLNYPFGKVIKAKKPLTGDDYIDSGEKACIDNMYYQEYRNYYGMDDE